MDIFLFDKFLGLIYNIFQNREVKVPRKLVFLDRDGVINKNIKGEYVKSWEGFTFLPRVLEGFRKLKSAGYDVIVISNQAGVAKGIYTKEELDWMTQNMLTEVAKAGGKINGVYYCLHRNEDECNCRKPESGLFEQAIKDHEVNAQDVFLVGDSERDIIAAKKVGCKTIMVLSGNTKKEDIPTFETKPDYIAEDLYDAVENIVLKND